MFDIPSHSFWAMALVLGLLLTGTGVQLLLQLKHPQRDYTELRQRINSWWWMIGLLFLVLWISKTATIVFFAFVSFLALKEFLSIVPIRTIDRPVVFLAYLAIPIQYYWVGISWYGVFIIFVPVYMFLLIPVRMVLLGETRGFIKAAGVLHWAVMLTVFSLSHIAYLLMLPEKNPQAGPIGLVLYLLFITQFNDVSQYIWGKTLGQRKIIPKISPNKTWEGFIGGLLTVTLISGLIAPLLTPLTLWQSFAAGLLIGASGFMGDLVISSVKRDLQIKDTGSLIPGHGGVLDRLDSLTYSAPLFFHFIYYLHY